jgi:hypothetical protein
MDGGGTVSLMKVGGQGAAAGGRRFPETLRLIGLYAWAADGRDEEAAGGKDQVANELGGEAVARTAGEQHILGVLLLFFGRGLGGLAIGGRGNHELYQAFDVPAVVHKICSKPIE